MKILRFLGSALANFDRDRGLFLASGIAFQMLLCLVPLILLVLSFAGSYLFAHERLIDQIGRYLEQAAPALDPAVRKNLLEVIGHRKTTGIVGTIALLWLATTVFGWLRIALNTIFGVAKARGTLRGMGLDLAMIVLCGASFLVSVGLTAVIQYLRLTPSPLLPALTGRLLGFALSYVVPFLVILVVCFLIYHLVPNRRVSMRAALLGAVFTGVLWEAAKHLFTWYVSAFGSYSLLYGSLSAAAVLLVWTYYSAAVLLLGAEVTVLLEKEFTAKGEKGGSRERSAAVFMCLLLGAPVQAAEQAPPAVSTPTITSAVVPADALPSDPATPADNAWRDPKTGIEFVRIPGGEFDMGSSNFDNEKPVHRVRIDEFWLAKTEVTRAQWRAIMGGTLAKQRGCDDCPVAEVSWDDVQKYLVKTAYRLPTEAEWEYAAGGGAKNQRWAGTSNERDLGEFAWYRGNSVNRPHPAGQKKPNLFGLFDMSGNVYEWCADWYDADYYRESPIDNPPGPASGIYRVARGGSWILDPRIAGVTFRLKSLPSRRRGYLGFRPALASPPR